MRKLLSLLYYANELANYILTLFTGVRVPVRAFVACTEGIGFPDIPFGEWTENLGCIVGASPSRCASVYNTCETTEDSE